MPFNGAGIFSRTPGTRIANQGALVSAQVNDETDNLVVGVNGKVNLDGLLAMTGLQALFADGTALLHGATVGQVQKNLLSHATTVAGTVDAIQVSMTPANTGLTNRERIRWTSAGANTITAPTISKDGGVTNKTIKKGASAALAVGDLGAAGQVNEAIYNGTDWLLLTATAGAAISAASTTENLTGTDTAKYLTADANAALWEKGSDIASAGTISIGEGGTFDVTGTTTITDIDPATDKAGRTFRLVHEAAHILTHNASTMINLTGANITTAAGDISTWQSEGSDVVRMVAYERASGAALVSSGGITLATEQATTSGTEKDFTSIPSTVKRITVMLDQVSGPVTVSPFIIQIGDSGGFETTGYIGGVSRGTTITNPSNGFGVTGTPSQTTNYSGAVTLCLQDASNTWVSSGLVCGHSGETTAVSGFMKQLTGTLDRVRFTTVNGTDAFDNGSVSISYE